MNDKLPAIEDSALPVASTAFLLHLRKLLDHEQNEMDRKARSIPDWDSSASLELSRMIVLHGLYHKIALAHALSN